MSMLLGTNILDVVGWGKAGPNHPSRQQPILPELSTIIKRATVGPPRKLAENELEQPLQLVGVDSQGDDKVATNGAGWPAFERIGDGRRPHLWSWGGELRSYWTTPTTAIVTNAHSVGIALLKNYQPQPTNWPLQIYE